MLPQEVWVIPSCSCTISKNLTCFHVCSPYIVGAEDKPEEIPIFSEAHQPIPTPVRSNKRVLDDSEQEIENKRIRESEPAEALDHNAKEPELEPTQVQDPCAEHKQETMNDGELTQEAVMAEVSRKAAHYASSFCPCHRFFKTSKCSNAIAPVSCWFEHII